MKIHIQVMAGIAALVMSGACEAQMRYFARQAIPTVKPINGPSPASKTLSCNGPVRTYTAPLGVKTGVGPIASASPTVDSSLKACNDYGAANGEALKAYTHCYIVVNQLGQNPTGYNVYLYQATGTYDYDRSNPYWGGYMTAACTYNP